MTHSAMLADIGGLQLLPFGLVALAFWVWMIVDCARQETEGSLVAWLLLILFVGVIGAPLYFFLRHLPKRRLAPFSPESPLYQPWPKNRRVE
jgi:hypothetical protein